MELVVAILGLITTLMAPALGYAFWRLRKLESETDQRHTLDLANQRIKSETLTKQLADMRFKLDQLKIQADQVPGLQRQINTLCEQIEDLQTWKKQAVCQLTQKDDTIEQQDQKIKTQTKLIIKHEDTIHRQGKLISNQNIRIDAMREMARLAGLDRSTKSEPEALEPAAERQEIGENHVSISE